MTVTKAALPRGWRRAVRVVAASVLAIAGMAAPPPRVVAALSVGSGGAVTADTFAFCVESRAILEITLTGDSGVSGSATLDSSPAGIVSFGVSASTPTAASLSILYTIPADGTFETSVVLRADAIGTTTIRLGGAALLGVVVDGIAGLGLAPVDATHALETTVGGFAFFPDLDTPTADPTDARSLWVQAQLELGTPGIEVQFKYADVDDPSANTSPVDANGSAGLDNRGTADLPIRFVDTDATGLAQTQVRLPMQPGDNIALLASCTYDFAVSPPTSYLNGVRITADSRLVDAAGRQLPTVAAELTDPVTTWRRLWLEVDSMGPVALNYWSGTIASTANSSTRINGVREPTTDITLATILDATGAAAGARMATGQFDGGVVGFPDGLGGVTAQPVLGTRVSKGIVTLVVPRLAAPVTEGTAYRVVDDDNASGIELAVNRNGDAGWDVPAPPLTYLQPSLSASSNWFAPAFVVPYALDGTEDVPFRLHETVDPTDAYCRVVTTPCPAGQSSFDNVAHAANPNYWVGYVLGAYQPYPEVDGDPAGEGGRTYKLTIGQTDQFLWGSAVFWEADREVAAGGFTQPICQVEGILVHELGHLFLGAGHTRSGIMAELCSSGSSTWSAASLAGIRSAVHP